MIAGEEKERLRGLIIESGASEAGFSSADNISPEADDFFARWLAEGKHAGMKWLENHRSLRSHPSFVLEDARSVISIAFSFRPLPDDPKNPLVASYALGRDYHKVLKKRLSPILDYLDREYGAKGRICIDSAPVAERYRALQAGIGRRGRNGMLLTESGGSMTFLAEIVTDLQIEPDATSPADLAECCLECDLCVRSCPTGALCGDSTLDARRCLSYLTIEHIGEWPSEIMESSSPLFGCDVCVRVCPAYSMPGKRLTEFAPRREVLEFTREEFASLTAEEARQRFAGTPIVRIARRLRK